MSSLQLALDVVEHIDRAASLPETAKALVEGLRPFGARSVLAQDTRLVQRIIGARSVPPTIALAPDGYAGSATAKFIEEINPNPATHRVLGRPFRWREAMLPTPALYRDYWDALSEFGAVDGLCIRTSNHGDDAAVSVGFVNGDWSPGEHRAMEFACYAFMNKARSFAPVAPTAPRLTPRERDCIAFVAAGKTDWEISTILSLSQATVRFHVDNARHKLGATTRAQAAACFVLLGLL
ncbi:hypothetical protein sos41_09010 [Alphaproteobacteria bacterium SO-S41]|nr:hypothetical protein sos41_09010 [Alphaproteobacteria bacterium SO-S41]